MSSGMKSYVDRVTSLLVGMSFSHEWQTLEGYSTCVHASLRYGEQEVGPMIVHHKQACFPAIHRISSVAGKRDQSQHM